MASQMLNSHSSIKFQWKITDFSKLGDYHDSGVFSVGNLKWRLRIHPKGNTSIFDSVSLYLVPVDKTKLPHVESIVVVTSQTDSKNNFKGTVLKHKFTQADSGWGWPKLMPLTQLHNQAKGYLQHDTCIIEVVVICLTREAYA